MEEGSVVTIGWKNQLRDMNKTISNVFIKGTDREGRVWSKLLKASEKDSLQWSRLR